MTTDSPRASTLYRGAILGLGAVVAGLSVMTSRLTTENTQLSTALAAVSQVSASSSSDRPAAASSAALAASELGESQQAGSLVIDVGQHLSDWNARRGEDNDISETYFSAPRAGVHVHALGFGQTTPLHVHLKTEEATIIVAGNPHVLQVFGHDGKLARVEQDYAPGTLISSPPGCGHEWHNPASDHFQANLVLSMPRFSGNLYLKPDDPRLLTGHAPIRFSPADPLKDFSASAEPARLLPLGLMSGTLAILFVRDAYSIPTANGPTIVYVVSGKGQLTAGFAAEQALASQRLAMVAAHTEGARLKAAAGEILTAYVFRPYDPWPR